MDEVVDRDPRSFGLGSRPLGVRRISQGTLGRRYFGGVRGIGRQRFNFEEESFVPNVVTPLCAKIMSLMGRREPSLRLSGVQNRAAQRRAGSSDSTTTGLAGVRDRAISPGPHTARSMLFAVARA